MDKEGQSAHEALDGEVTAACNGDASALSRLMEIVRPRLKQTVNAHMRWPLSQKVDASDLAQEALLAAVRGFASFRGRTWNEFAAWATRIARMEVLKANRHWKMAMRDLRREHPVESEAQVDRPTELHVTGWRETAAQLLQLIESLPAEFQKALKLRYFEGLSIRAIAEKLERSPDAVVGTLRRGLEWLRELAQQKGLDHE
ncbi:MAG: RNA polymerase sigma factor [Pirellulales bacterium]|nr:RNA polymerase sigma factor [Pirellulales bacterium]